MNDYESQLTVVALGHVTKLIMEIDLKEFLEKHRSLEGDPTATALPGYQDFLGLSRMAEALLTYQALVREVLNDSHRVE